MVRRLKPSRTMMVSTCTFLLLCFMFFGAAPSALAAQQQVGAWAGYGFNGIHNLDPNAPPVNLAKISGATATVTVPCLDTTGPLGTFHAWVGIGGARTNFLIRAGVTAGAFIDRNGQMQTNYLAWIATPSQLRRFLPSFYLWFAPFTCPSNPGSVTIDIDIHADGRYHIQVDGGPSHDLNSKALGAVDASTAEFIVEGSAQTLARSGSIVFADVTVLGNNDTDTFGINDAVHHLINHISGVRVSSPGSQGSTFSVS